MAGSLGDLGGLLRQAQKMQRQVAELQEELNQRTFEGSAGGGAVTAKVSGARQILEIKIQPEVVNPEEVDLLEDLVSGAVREALRKAEESTQAEMQKVTGGMGLPGLM
ncbi:MAG: YbaB/EbfC family nucleoid-associated protein [Planctomycetota bacterium]|nr:MAG: YbaB/EbfC family nucleoid-associated protein [Planctomycetota bacterium]